MRRKKKETEMKPNSGIERGRGRERDRALMGTFSHVRASDDEMKLFGIPELTKDEHLPEADNSGDDTVIGSYSHREQTKKSKIAAGGPYIGINKVSTRKFRMPVPTTSESVRRMKE